MKSQTLTIEMTAELLFRDLLLATVNGQDPEQILKNYTTPGQVKAKSIDE